MSQIRNFWLGNTVFKNNFQLLTQHRFAHKNLAISIA